MNRLENVVKDYLSKETNYAMLVSGEWGTGKTYYFKNTLSPMISDTLVFKDQEKKYKPVYLSLFGIKSIEDLETRILLAIYPILKGAKFTDSIIKPLLKGYLALKGLSEIGEVIDSVKPSKAQKLIKIDFEELVLCFDDLERRSEDFILDELIGFINTLVENENIKVLIIANEKEIKTTNYIILKEKTIGNTVEFIPDIKTSIRELIEKKMASFSACKEFLLFNIDFIGGIFVPNSKNLRILDYTISNYLIVFSSIEKNMIKGSGLEEYKNEILLSSLKFMLVISIEYKLGKISFSNPNGIDMSKNRISDYALDNIFYQSLRKNDRNDNPDYREVFLRRYYPNDQYNYYKSLFDYVTGANSFEYGNFKEEIVNIYHLINDNVPEHFKVLNELSYNNCYTLTESNYKKLTFEMLSFAQMGQYNLIDYTTVFHFCTRFENPYRFNKEKLTKKLLKGLNLKINDPQFKYDNHVISRITWQKDDPDKEYYKLIRNGCHTVNEMVKLNSEQLISKRLEDLFCEDLNTFYNIITKHDSNERFNPFFHNFKAARIYSFLINQDNSIRYLFLNILRERYRDSYESQILKQELNFLRFLYTKFDGKCTKVKNKGLTGFLFHEIKEQLKFAIEVVSKEDN